MYRASVLMLLAFISREHNLVSKEPVRFVWVFFLLMCTGYGTGLFHKVQMQDVTIVPKLFGREQQSSEGNSTSSIAYHSL